MTFFDAPGIPKGRGYSPRSGVDKKKQIGYSPRSGVDKKKQIGYSPRSGVDKRSSCVIRPAARQIRDSILLSAPRLTM